MIIEWGDQYLMVDVYDTASFSEIARTMSYLLWSAYCVSVYRDSLMFIDYGCLDSELL
jgi:hypothetical protein